MKAISVRLFLPEVQVTGHEFSNLFDASTAFSVIKTATALWRVIFPKAR